jgi:hypothetical protein
MNDLGRDEDGHHYEPGCRQPERKARDVAQGPRDGFHCVLHLHPRKQGTMAGIRHGLQDQISRSPDTGNQILQLVGGDVLFIDAVHRRHERLLVDLGDDLDAGRTDLFLGCLFAGHPHFAHDRDGVLGSLANGSLILGRQLVPGCLGHHQHFRHDQVLVQRIVAGDLVVARGFKRRPVVFRTVDDAGLDRRIDLAIGHRRGVGAKRSHHVDEDVGLHDADLHALEVLDRPDRLDLVVEAARAAVIEGEADIAMRLERQDVVADRAVHDPVHVVNALEDVGQRDDLGFLDQVVERAHRDAVQIDHAELGLLDRVLFLPSWAEWNTSTQMRPLVRSSRSLPMCLTASTVG